MQTFTSFLESEDLPPYDWRQMGKKKSSAPQPEPSKQKKPIPSYDFRSMAQAAKAPPSQPMPVDKPPEAKVGDYDYRAMAQVARAPQEKISIEDQTRHNLISVRLSSRIQELSFDLTPFGLSILDQFEENAYNLSFWTLEYLLTDSEVNISDVAKALVSIGVTNEVMESVAAKEYFKGKAA